MAEPLPLDGAIAAVAAVRGGCAAARPHGSTSVVADVRPALDVIPAKIRPPALRPGLIARVDLVGALRREAPRVASVVAPAGFGKTTLLAQWAAADNRPVVWVSLDARDDDPYGLLKHLVAAVDGVEHLDRRLVASLAAPRTDPWAVLLRSTAKAFGALRKPFLLVLDNVDLVRTRDARALLTMLVSSVPESSTVALASRTPPKLPLARLRAGGALREVGTRELALQAPDAHRLVRAANDRLSDAQAAGLVAACEGWPAGLYLASLSLHDPRPGRRTAVAGSDRYLTDYVRAEYLSHLKAAQRRFLRRTSILEELSGPVCDAVVQEAKSDRMLESLARGTRVLVRSEDSGAYRLPRLVRQVLERELSTDEPQSVRTLHRRAAKWYEAHGDGDAALVHAQRAQDPDRVAAIIATIALPASCRGRVSSIEHAIAAFEASWPLERYPEVALHASRIHAFQGRTADAERCLAIAERAARRGGRGAAALRSRLAVVRAALCRSGPRRMLVDAKTALATLPPESQWHPVALHLHACAAMLFGATDEAIESLGDAAAAAEEAGLHLTQTIALGQRSLLVREAGDADHADALASEALAAGANLNGDPGRAVALAAGAQLSLRQGHVAEAAEHVAAAQELASSLTDSLPWLAVQTRLSLGRSSICLGDEDSARAAVAENAGVLNARPELGVFVERANELRAEVTEHDQPVFEVPSLTAAELRLLPLLATHLSFREIAEQLEVSRNTVKTQAISIYRKLGVSGRSEAIAAARSESTTFAPSIG